MKRKFRVVDQSGVSGFLHELHDGQFACMICGEPWPYPPMEPVEEEIGPIRHLCRYTVGDICNGCGTEYGVDIPYTFEAFRERRTQWLNDRNWSPAALAKLKNNLELDEGKLRREAGERRSKP